MISLYNSIINYSQQDLKTHLNNLGVSHIFEELSVDFDEHLFAGVVKYILFGYSLDSEVLHSTGISWSQMSKIIYEKSGLPNDSEIYDKVSNLKSDKVKDAIEKWVSLQESENFTEYVNARDLRRYCLQQSQTADKIKERMDAMKYAKELLVIMEDSKSKFVANYEIMKAPLAALKKEKQKNTLGPQDYAN